MDREGEKGIKGVLGWIILHRARSKNIRNLTPKDISWVALRLTQPTIRINKGALQRTLEAAKIVEEEVRNQQSFSGKFKPAARRVDH